MNTDTYSRLRDAEDLNPILSSMSFPILKVEMTTIILKLTTQSNNYKFVQEVVTHFNW